MAIYNFSFPAAAAGLTATIRDDSGATVASQAVPSATDVQGPAVVAAELPVGWYAAQAVDAAINADFRAPGIIDVPASLSSGFTLDVPYWYFELNNGLDLPIATNTEIAWDTVYGSEDGYSDYAGASQTHLTFGAGVYLVDFELDIEQPTSDRLVNSSLLSRPPGAGRSISANGARTLLSKDTGLNFVTGSGSFVLREDDWYGVLSAGQRVTDDADSGAETLSITWGYMSVLKIG